MTDLSVQNIVKSFEEDKNLLDGLSFDILAGEHVGLLGRNGCGKTTLFRIITGELRPDEGEIAVPEGKRIGLLSQIPFYPAEYTTEDVLKSAHRRVYEIQKEMRELERRMAGGADGETLRRYDGLAASFESLGGYDIDRMRNTVANGLMIPASQRQQLFSSLSGGEKTRVNLARLILEDTDILLLDEPTNHLDLRATEWLEEFLKKFRGTVLTISHDRYFLDSVVTRTIEIVRGKAEFYSGNYSFYVDEKQRRFEEQLKKYEKEQTEIKRLEEAAARLYQWGTGNEKLMKKSFAIQSRIRRMSRTERPDTQRKMSVKFREREFRGDEVIVMKGVTKSFGEKPLFSGLELTIFPGDRIGLIGDNGTGKSTLVRMIMQEERPDSGLIRKGPSVKPAYLPQIVTFSHPERNVLDTMVYDENCSPQTARNRLGSFQFTGEDVFRPVSQLSGGEMSRLKLCILMKDDVNFLILDEPTNHLDIDSREWIENAVDQFDGTLLFVSHDRYFISRFANRIWELSDGTVHDFAGTFEQYRASQEMLKEAEEREKAAKPEKKKAAPVRLKTSPARQMEKLEAEIGALEKEKVQVEADTEEYATDYEKLMELDGRKKELEKALEEKYTLWDQLAEQET